MNSKIYLSKSDRGFTLVEGLVTIAIMSIAGWALVQQNVTSMKSIKSNNLRLEIQDIKRTITSRLSCIKSLGATIPTTCSGSVVLRDSSNSAIVPTTGKLGAWNISSRCEVLNGKNGLSIYATKKTTTGAYAKDPLNPNIIYDETSPISLIFAADLRPCGNWFDGVPSASCGPGQYVKNVNFNDKSLTCANLPQCPVGQFLRGYNPDGSPNCRDSGARVVGGVECLQCENGTVCGPRNEWGGATCSGASPVCSSGLAQSVSYYHDDLSKPEGCYAACGPGGTNVVSYHCIIND